MILNSDHTKHYLFHGTQNMLYRHPPRGMDQPYGCHTHGRGGRNYRVYGRKVFAWQHIWPPGSGWQHYGSILVNLATRASFQALPQEAPLFPSHIQNPTNPPIGQSCLCHFWHRCSPNTNTYTDSFCAFLICALNFQHQFLIRHYFPAHFPWSPHF